MSKFSWKREGGLGDDDPSFWTNRKEDGSFDWEVDWRAKSLMVAAEALEDLHARLKHIEARLDAESKQA